MINLSKLKKEQNFVLNTNTTIIKQNYLELEKILKLLEKFPIDSIVLNVVIPWEKANKNNTIVKYSVLAKELEKLLKFQKKYKNIYINWIPFCLGESLNMMMGFREAVIFDQDWKEFTRHSDNQKIVNKTTKIINWKVKRKECLNCKYFNICEWVWQSYIEIYWWDEFLPVI